MEAIRTNGKKKVPVIAVDEEELRTHVSGAVRLRSRFSYVKDVASVKDERDYLKKTLSLPIWIRMGSASQRAP